MKQNFYFSTCQTGAEKAVKTEIAHELPEMRFAFSRPGFVTFKNSGGDPAPIFPGRLIFTRLWGEVLGQARDRAGLHNLISLIPRNAVVQAFDRDLHLPGEEPEGFIRNSGIKAVLEEYRGGHPGVSDLHLAIPGIGKDVYSLIWVDDFHVFLGRHRHTGDRLPTPGNMPDLRLPPESPSRSWLKIEEAILRFRPRLETGMTVLEVGCAPGGATSALLSRGLRVTGIDPQFMDESVRLNPRFTAIRKPARYLVADEVREINPDILVMDMSIAPHEALAELSHVVHVLRHVHRGGLGLSQGFLTLKLNDWKYADDIPQYLDRLGETGFRDLLPTQLCSNRREFFVYSPRFE